MDMAPQSISAPSGLNFVFAEATGSFLVLLAIAQQQRLFERYRVDIEPMAARGATVPRLTHDAPIGLIGEPAAILQAAEGAELRIVASLSSTPLSGHLVARPGIKTAKDLRGRRIGVRVLGAGIWISTVLALEQLGLSPGRDGVVTVPIGGPAQIVRALEGGAIDAALVTVAQSRALQANGYVALLTDYPAGIAAYGGCLAVTPDYMTARPDVVQAVTAALTDALAFALAEKNDEAVMQAFRTSLDITDTDTALRALRELRPKPYPSCSALEKMQSIMAAHDPRVAGLKLESLVDERFVRTLDESGAIARLYDAYGPRRNLSCGQLDD